MSDENTIKDLWTFMERQQREFINAVHSKLCDLDEREDRLSEEAWSVAADIIKRAGDQTLSTVEELIRDEILLHRREIERLQVDEKRLDYLIEHDAGLTRDSIDASMTWKGTGNDDTDADQG